MVTRSAKYNPRRVNAYVPAMAYHNSLVHGGPYEVNFGAPAVASAANILSATSISAIGNTSTFLQDNTDPVVAATQALFPYGPGFGRVLQYVASGASTATVTTKGRDYMGQPMTEVVTLNGATPVIGNKAFKYIDNISWTAGGAVTMNVGTGAKLGLPFCVKQVLGEFADGVPAAVGTLVTPSLVDPQVAGSFDPRGVYTPTTTPDGSKELRIEVVYNNKLNANGNGGLHGLQHYYA